MSDLPIMLTRCKGTMSRNLVRLTCDSRIQFLDKMPFCMKATKSKGIFQISKSSEDMPTCNFSGGKKNYSRMYSFD